MIRPGPTHLTPGLVPGGFVIHVYGTSAPGRLLRVDFLTPTDDVDRRAEIAAHFVGGLLGDGEDTCLVFYDGDSGQRVIPPGYNTGDQVTR